VKFPAIADLALAALALTAVSHGANAADSSTSLCGGQRYVLSTVPHGASPYIRLTAKGVSGQFLLDYGSTGSSLTAKVFASSHGLLGASDLSMPGFKGGRFALQGPSFSSLPPGRLLGMIGTDLLSQMSVQFTHGSVFLSNEVCPVDKLRALGFAPINQHGFFSSEKSAIDPSHANVPIVYVSIGDVRVFAQFDTGYDDLRYLHTIDINQSLFDRLIASGAELEQIDETRFETCRGSENRKVYRMNNRNAVIENERAEPIVAMRDVFLSLKQTNGCGGIAASSVPAAQLAASFLDSFGTIIFDGKLETVWLGGDKRAEPSAQTSSGSSAIR
jgi:hypothetical protein